MTRARVLLVPNPHGIDVAVPAEVELDAAGAAPQRFEYDGSPYRLIDGLGPEGQPLYELLE